MKNSISLIFALTLLLSFTSCKKSEEEITPELTAISYELIFQADEDQKNIILTNPTDKKLTYDLSISNNYLIVPERYGHIEANDSIVIELHVNRALIPAEEAESTITIRHYYGSINIPVTIHHVPERKIKLRLEVDYAAFSNYNDMLYLKPKSFNKGNYYLITYDVSKDSLTEIPLSFYYNKIHVSEDGQKLILLSWNKLYLLDINTYNIELELDLMARDIICTPEKMYIFPTGSHNYDHQIYVFADGTLNNGWMNGVNDYSEFDAHLHPNGEYIYAFNTNRYQENLVRLGLKNSNHFYSEKLDGIYKQIWLSKDGSKLFSVTNTYYDIIPNSPSFDLIEKQFELQKEGEILNFDESISKQEFYFSLDKGDHFEENVVYAYNSDMTFKRIIEAEDYMRTGFNNGVYYEYQKPTIKYLFYSEKSDKLVLVTYSKNYFYDCAIDVVDL